MKCHAGCSVESVLEAMNLRVADLFATGSTPQSNARREAARYAYLDENGVLLYEVVRTEPKGFYQRRPDGSGAWIHNLGDVRRVLYRLPQLKGETCFVTEGEKDCDALFRLGLAATTNAGGAGKWRPEYVDQLMAAGIKNVVVLPDNDESGRRHAEAVADACTSRGLKVKVASVPGVGLKGDISDFISAGNGRAAVLQLARDAALYEPKARTKLLGMVTPISDKWPAPIARVGYQGLVGDIVRALNPETEADPAALLVQMLVMFGSVIGRTAHFRVNGTTHYLNLFAGVVGRTAGGRKGLGRGQAQRIFEPVDHGWKERITSGLSSGEGLIWAVRDPIEKRVRGNSAANYETVIEDPGVDDKRLLVIESEFASVLKVMAREGNTLSAVIRQAWDGEDLRTLTKSSTARSTHPHISIIGHITSDELRRYLEATETANGFGNRFLWVCSRRSKLLPDGGNDVPIEQFISRMRAAVDYARGVGEMKRDHEAASLWHGEYARLSNVPPGMLGAMTARAEAQSMRLACLFALTDLSSIVRAEHLSAALEVWRYCFASARHIFGDTLGDRLADDLLAALRDAGQAGKARSELHEVTRRNRSAADITRALNVLHTAKLARMEVDTTGTGRPAERWYATERDERNEETPTMAVSWGVNSSNSFKSYPAATMEGGDADGFGVI
jgi:5S rRNA maturation endonuclease (ribonuclease M5)